MIDLYKDATGSAIAGDPVKQVQLLGEAIPALSTPVGQQKVNILDENRNHNMPLKFGNPSHWPRGKDVNEVPVWFHSDIRDVAYLYCFGFFDAITQISNQ